MFSCAHNYQGGAPSPSVLPTSIHDYYHGRGETATVSNCHHDGNNDEENDHSTTPIRQTFNFHDTMINLLNITPPNHAQNQPPLFNEQLNKETDHHSSTCIYDDKKASVHYFFIATPSTITYDDEISALSSSVIVTPLEEDLPCLLSSSPACPPSHNQYYDTRYSGGHHDDICQENPQYHQKSMNPEEKNKKRKHQEQTGGSHYDQHDRCCDEKIQGSIVSCPTSPNSLFVSSLPKLKKRNRMNFLS